MLRPRLLPLLALPACSGPCAPSVDSADSSPPAERCAFSFAILTDTHIGEGIQDYGGAGWDDAQEGDTASDSEALLASAVAEINTAAQTTAGPAFVVVLGDLTDSGERSELERSRELLEALEIPWLPLLGNHEVWPYAWDTSSDSWGEAEEPHGDALMLEVFEDSFAQAAADIPSLVQAPAVWVLEHEADTPFVSFAFSHCGVRFVALDTNTRTHAPEGYPGIGPEAALYDAEGAPWPWLVQDVTAGPGAREGTVVVLGHHPFTNAGLVAFDQDAFDRMEADIQDHGLEQRIAAFFGGHLHFDNQGEGPAGIPVVLTAATKDGRGPRLIQVSETGELDWETD